MNPVFEQMSRIGIIPVIALDDAGDAAPLAEALLNGGIRLWQKNNPNKICNLL